MSFVLRTDRVCVGTKAYGLFSATWDTAFIE